MVALPPAIDSVAGPPPVPVRADGALSPAPRRLDRRANGGARAASRSSRRPVPPVRPVRPAPVARRAARRVQRQADGRRPRRLPVRDLAGTDRWSTPARQVTIGSRADRRPRFSPDGRTLAFISDRRLLVEEEPDRPKEAKDRLDCDQLFLLPLDGGEARRLTDLPRGVTDLAWSPDGRSLAVLSSSRGATMAEDDPPLGAPAEAQARRDAAVRLPLHRPAGVPVQRHRLHRRPRRAPVGGRRRDGRGTIAGRRADGRGRARLEPRRHPHRVHRQPPAAAGPRRPLVGVRRGRRVARGDHDRRRRRHAVRRAHLDAGRRLDPRHRRAIPARLLPDRDLGLRGGRRPTPARAAARTCSPRAA